jgi:hypothetical protein
MSPKRFENRGAILRSIIIPRYPNQSTIKRVEADVPIVIAVHKIAYLLGRGTNILPIQMAEADASTQASAVRIGLIYGNSLAKKR